MDVMTQGYSKVCTESVAVAKWGVLALRSIRRDGSLPDFVVGRPGDKPMLEDDGRTLVLPLQEPAPKCYAALNETGGVTLMTADEY